MTRQSKEAIQFVVAGAASIFVGAAIPPLLAGSTHWLLARLVAGIGAVASFALVYWAAYRWIGPGEPSPPPEAAAPREKA